MWIAASRCHPHKLGFQPQPLDGSRKLVNNLEAIAHNLAVYPTGFAHVMAQLPRLILLVRRRAKLVAGWLLWSGRVARFNLWLVGCGGGGRVY
jgi:hypothetical protein